MCSNLLCTGNSEIIVFYFYLFLNLGLIHNLTLDDRMIELTKQKLYYHFQNPCWKFRVKGTKPIKMMVQVIKIIFVTLQVCVLVTSHSWTGCTQIHTLGCTLNYHFGVASQVLLRGCKEINEKKTVINLKM